MHVGEKGRHGETGEGRGREAAHTAQAEALGRLVISEQRSFTCISEVLDKGLELGVVRGAKAGDRIPALNGRETVDARACATNR